MCKNEAQATIELFNKAVLVIFSCSFCYGGALVGFVTGAITGQTSETGFICGAGIGAVSGAIVAIELTDSLLDGRHFNSKVSFLYSLATNGEELKEWFSSAMLKAYPHHSNTLDPYENEVSDIFDIDENKGVSPEFMNNLPMFRFCLDDEMTDLSSDGICCTICLENLKDGESARRLTNCGHPFHLDCIDAWLVKHDTCPICRRDV